jgi:hypothetical protein
MVIPATVWDAPIRDKAKLCYGHITVLANKTGYAYATNSYFAKVLNVSTTSASQYISELEKLGVIQTELIYKEGTKEVDKRKIYLTSIPVKDNFNTPVKDILNGPVEDIFKDNNTSNNNTRDNIIDVPLDDDIKGKMFFRLVDMYPKNRVGNRQHGLKKFKGLDTNQGKLTLINLNRYLKVAGPYVKNLQNYIIEECWSEDWLRAEETKLKTTSKKDINHNFSSKY